MTLYGAAKAPGAELREAGTTVAALTDDSGGTATETLALMVNLATLTNSTGGTAADVLAAVTNIATLTDSTSGASVTDIKEVVSGGSGATAGAFAGATERDAAIVIMNDNNQALAVALIAQRAWNVITANTVTTIGRELIAQKAANTILINSVASLANKVSDLITHLNDGR